MRVGIRARWRFDYNFYRWHSEVLPLWSYVQFKNLKLRQPSLISLYCPRVVQNRRIAEYSSFSLQIRLNQGIPDDSQATPPPPELVPPSTIFSPWCFQVGTMYFKRSVFSYSAFTKGNSLCNRVIVFNCFYWICRRSSYLIAITRENCSLTNCCVAWLSWFTMCLSIQNIYRFSIQRFTRASSQMIRFVEFCVRSFLVGIFFYEKLSWNPGEASPSNF